MKIRIFALAKEMGMANKELIELCARAGIQVKSSALASITEEERDTVRKHFEQEKNSANASQEAPAVVDTPVRERKPTTGKVRSIRPMAPRPHHGSQREATPDTPPAVETPAEDPVPAEVTQADEPVEQVDETPADTAPAPKAEADQPAEPVAEVEQAETPAEPETAPEAEAADEQVAPAEPTAQDDGGNEEKRPAPLSRDEYVPAAGASSGRSMREMKPIGTVRQGKGKGGAQKQQRAMPTIAAAPNYKPPEVRTEKTKEQPAQKPDMPLTAELLEQQSPLADRLQRNKGRGGSDGNDGGRRRGGGLIEKRRRENQTLQQQRQLNNRRRGRGGRSKRRSAPIELKTSATIELPITVRSLSESIGRPAKQIMTELFKKGTMVKINDMLDEEDAMEIAMDLGVDLDIKRGRDLEQELSDLLDVTDPEDAELAPRPPIVTILGHVDHGKTTLLDTIRQSNVVDGEAGGITQHIASYQVVHNDQPITFVDTPGHAAFGEMRARGANVTDIIILVVAADDGIMPQTEECIAHAKAAGVPIIIAMNKIDLPDVDEQRVLQGLAQHELLPAEWGGDYDVVRTSALAGTGIDELLETILLQAELLEFKANPKRNALGLCLEAFLEQGRGVLAWFIVQKGTLRVGDVVLCGQTIGRIRAIYNDRNEEITEAPPSMPVKVAGLEEVPGAGDHFFVMDSLEEARTVAAEREEAGRTAVLSQRGRPSTLEDILGKSRGEGIRDLNLILKADTPGSLEALRGEISKFEHPEVRVVILHEGVGGVNESDVYLASASESGAIIIAFHVIAEDKAQMLAERESVEIRRYSIIYEVTEHIKMALEGLLRPELVHVSTGRALVLKTFNTSKFGTIAGCRVLSGTISRENRVHVIRDQKVLNDYRINSLKREKDDAKEVRDGMECGIRLDGFNDVKEGDLLEAFRVDEVQRTLD